MSVRVEGGVIHLMGRCPADDAEDLLRQIQENPDFAVDISEAKKLHTAVMQILLALSPAVQGRPSDGSLSHELMWGLISKRDRAQKNF
ncbi:hypothetical protein [Novosphingobium terrae]|uniref:hypothetical protein n=1 Tax=Novosphingobium terrae TaxID=2726189 RepID=UPI00197DE1D6|nr:hypothetical protein [Novosphingobium terrae]